MYEVRFEDQASLDFALLAVRNRLSELAQYHYAHPELPRQDDIVATYQRAEVVLDEASRRNDYSERIGA